MRIFYFLYLFPLFLFGSILDPKDYVFQGPASSWVKPQEISLENRAENPSQIHLQYLLLDAQRNWEDKTTYRHSIVKALTPNGASSMSQIEIEFDPLYYRVVIHNIDIFRHGKWSDRLKKARQEILQREEGLEESCYDGNLTLICFLSDIREGDVIDFSYSIIGHNPFWASHYTDQIYLQRRYPVEKIAYRLLAPSSFSFLTKCFNIDISPQVTDISSSLREWVWEAKNTKACQYEPNQPSWYDPLSYVEVTQFTSWHDVVQKIYPFYQLPADFADALPSDMKNLVDEWKHLTPDPHERALLALRFVQDEIRYLSLMKGMEPHSPCITFERRFGDCKDKSFLLHALLHLMDISSKLLLVHSTEGKNLPDSLPLPFIFDHAVLQIEIDGLFYYVDPTISFQGGSLKTTYFPDYKWGLLVAPGTNNLMALAENQVKFPIKMESFFVLESQDLASLTIKSIFCDFDADRFRRYLEHNGLQSLADRCLSEMQEVYGAACLKSFPEVIDDRKSNSLILIESYRLPTQKLSGKKLLKIYSYILRHSLERKVNPMREAPYEIEYPLWVKERIYIENPFNKWKSFQETYTQQHESFVYHLLTDIEGNHAYFDIELKHIKDHIPIYSLQEYWSIIDDIEWHALPRLIISSSKS